MGNVETVNQRIHYSVLSRKKKSNKRKLEVLERKLQQLEAKQFNQGLNLQESTGEQIRLVRHEILEINKESTKGAMIRARARYANLGEKPTKYFLNLENAKLSKENNL